MLTKLEFRPSRLLLALWMAPLIVIAVIVGAAVFGAVSSEYGASLNAALFGLLGFVLAAVIIGIPLVVHFFSIRYEIDDRYVIKHAGVLWKVRRLTPLEKITNIDVRQGPLEQLLGLGQLWVFTPSTGSLMPEVKLAGLAEPERWKQAIIERNDAVKGRQALSDDGTPRPAAPLSGGSGDEVAATLREIAATLKRIEGKLDEK